MARRNWTPYPSPIAEPITAPGVLAEWQQDKHRYLFWINGEKAAYAASVGNKWTLYDAGHGGVVNERFADTGPEAVERFAAMTLDGSWSRYLEESHAREKPKMAAETEAWRRSTEAMGKAQALALADFLDPDNLVRLADRLGTEPQFFYGDAADRLREAMEQTTNTREKERYRLAAERFESLSRT